MVMSSYENGAFEALHWAWKVLKQSEDDSESVETVKQAIVEKLSLLRQGSNYNFDDPKPS